MVFFQASIPQSKLGLKVGALFGCQGHDTCMQSGWSRHFAYLIAWLLAIATMGLMFIRHDLRLPMLCYEVYFIEGTGADQVAHPDFPLDLTGFFLRSTYSNF